jgi:hypothetical protein
MNLLLRIPWRKQKRNRPARNNKATLFTHLHRNLLREQCAHRHIFNLLTHFFNSSILQSLPLLHRIAVPKISMKNSYLGPEVVEKRRIRKRNSTCICLFPKSANHGHHLQDKVDRSFKREVH